MSQPVERPIEPFFEWDAGFAFERTALSWQRTAIATIALAALVVRAGFVDRLLELAIPIAALIVLAGVMEWLYSWRIYTEHDRPVEDGAVLHGSVFVAIGTVTLVAAGASAALALAG
jgi:hypothetical protein